MTVLIGRRSCEKLNRRPSRDAGWCGAIAETAFADAEGAEKNVRTDRRQTLRKREIFVF